MEDSVVSLMAEIRERLELLESGLPKRVDAMAASRISKLPYKVLLYRECLIWRMSELGRSSFDNFERDKLVAAIVLARAALETSAALWYLSAKVETAVESNEIGDIDVYLMKLVAGMATVAPQTDPGSADVTLPRPVKVRDFLAQADKNIEGFSHQYGVLCEYAHPNWAGTVLMYAKQDQKSRLTDFGPGLLKGESSREIGLCNLSVALAMFETGYNRISDLLPSFTEICESRLKKIQDNQTNPG